MYVTYKYNSPFVFLHPHILIQNNPFPQDSTLHKLGQTMNGLMYLSVNIKI